MLHRGIHGLALAVALSGPAHAEYTFRPFNTGGGGIGSVSGIVKGDGAGNPSQAIAGTDYVAPSAFLTSLLSVGIGCAAHSATNVWMARTITGTAGQIAVANGDCTSGNPTLSFPSQVGIGTTSPVRKLDVIVSATAAVTNQVRVAGFNASFEAWNHTGAANWSFGVCDAQSDTLWIGGGYSCGQGGSPFISYNGLGYATFGAFANLIQDGVYTLYVGPTTVNDDHILTVLRDYVPGTSEALTRFKHFNTGATPQPIFSFVGGRGTFASPSAIHAGDALGILDFRGYFGNAGGPFNYGESDTAAQISAHATENWAAAAGVATNMGTSLSIYTTPNAAGEAPALRQFIDQNGFIGFGTASPSAQLHTTGTVLLGSAGGSFKSGNTGIGGVSGCLSSDGATPANITAGTCGTGTLPTGGALGQILGKYDATNGHSNWYTPADFNISMDPTADCTGVVASDTAFTTAFASNPVVLVPKGCTIKLSNNNTIAKGNTLVVPNGGVLSLDAKTTAVSAAVTCPSACVTANVRLTVGSTAYLATGMRVTVASVGGTTEANGSWIIVVIDGTHIDLVGTTFVNAYTSGGTVQVCNLLFHGVVAPTNGRVFSGSGLACGVANVQPEWFGAANDGSTDDIAALRAAWNSVASSAASDGAPTIRLAPGSLYAITDQWTVAPSFSIPLRIVGSGTSKSGICAKSGFSATSAVQVNGQKANGITEVSDFDFRGWRVDTCSGVANTGLAVRGITFGNVGQQIQGTQKSYVGDLLVNNFQIGIYDANTRLIKFERVAVNLPKLNNSICLELDQLDTTNFTSDQRWSDFQCVPWTVAVDGITGQRDIYFRTSAGTTGLAGMFFDNATLYAPTNAGSYFIEMLCDGANVTETWFTNSQLDGGASTAKAIYAHTNGTGQCYDINISGGYMQGVGGDGIYLDAASADKIYDVTITNFTPFRGIGGTPILARRTNNVVIANNTFTSAPGVAQFIFLDTAYGTALTGNVANAAGGGTSTYFVEGGGTSLNTGCVNNRAQGVVGTAFSNGMGGGFNDCTGGGVNANRP